MLEFCKYFCYIINGRLYERKGDALMDAIRLSQYVISCFEEKKSPVTNLKLQKVLYYIQGYFFRELNRPAFAEEIYNWQYGPVVPVVYYEYNYNGAAPLKSSRKAKDISLSTEEVALVERVVEKCCNMLSSRLVSKTHSETPWRDSVSGSIISKRSIANFFMNNNPLEI